MSDRSVASSIPAQPQAEAQKQVAASRWQTEDWVAVLLGFVVIALVVIAAQWKLVDLGNLRPTFRWTTDTQLASMAPGWTRTVESVVRDATAKKHADVVAAGTALKTALGGNDRKAVETAAGQLARVGGKGLAGTLGTEVRGHAAATEARVFSGANLTKVLWLGVGYLVVAALGIALLGRALAPFLLGLPVVFALAFAARLLAGNGLFVDWGIEYVIFALCIGLLINNTVGTPKWLQPAIQTEFFIKTGLVVLGAGLLFYEVLQAGALGIIQAVAVVFVVWYSCYWLCQRLKVDDEFAAMLSTAVSICGVSAAIAACGAIQGDKKKLSYVTSLVLIVAVPMMIAMPWIAKVAGMDDLVAGAWLGGTLDTSASVVAAGALISESAMKTGVIVKFSQNALIGVAAFALAIWWAFKTQSTTGERPSASVIWERFPKFVIGFVLASALFSFALSPELVSATKSTLGELRTWWFALAFVCIGLETRFLDLAKTDQGRPAMAFIGAQTFNVFWTLLIAWLLFGGVLVAQPVIK
jgi:uncharacterized membrane protein YadS